MSYSQQKKVLVTRNIPEECLVILKQNFQVEVCRSDDPVPVPVFKDKIKGCHGLFCFLTDRVDKSLLDAAGPQLEVVATMSVGCDHLDIPVIKARGVRIGYTPDVLTNATAELGVSLLLAVARRLSEGVNAVKNGDWSSWHIMWMCGMTLEDATVGVIGLGRIGERIVEMLQPFRVAKFLYTGNEKKPAGDRLKAEFVPLSTLLEQSDVVIVSCALTQETRHLINKRTLEQMKHTAILINISRGDVVNQEELVVALRSGDIHAAGLDVTTPEPLPPHHPLLTLPNCIVLPHIGSATVKTRTDMAMLTAHNIIAALTNKPMPKELLLQ